MHKTIKMNILTKEQLQFVLGFEAGGIKEMFLIFFSKFENPHQF